MQQSRIFVGMVLILIFGEVLGLYGYVFEEDKAVFVRYTDERQFDSGVNIEYEDGMRCVTSADYFMLPTLSRPYLCITPDIIAHSFFFLLSILVSRSD